MRHDQHLVSLWLNEVNRHAGTDFRIQAWKDEAVRDRPAVEAIAEDSVGRTIAIEHTLIQPFVGEKEDTTRFMKAIAPLDHDPALCTPGYMDTLYIKVGALPKGIVWANMVHPLRKWLQQNMANWPEGVSRHRATILSVPLELEIERMTFDDASGRFLVARRPPFPSFQDVVRAALWKKLPKLTGTQAGKRVLLFEQEQIAESPVSLRKALDAISVDFPTLTQVHEIWVAVTTCWEREQALWFYEIVPNLGGRRFSLTVPKMLVP